MGQCNTISFKEKEELDLSGKDSPREEFPEIQEFKKKIKDIEIFQRPKIAEMKYNNLKNQKKKILINKEIRKRYIEIYELLLLNDTNKNIVELYLDFISEHKTFIDKNKRNSFEKEIKKYKILFDVNEEKYKKYKQKSEKTFFLDYLTKLSNSNDYKKIYQEAKKAYMKIYHFNYPIEFSNLELFYYKLYILLIGEIAERYEKTPDDFENYIINRKKIVNMVINKNLFSIENIVNNEDKINILIILILYDNLNNNNESINFNRLFYSNIVNYKELEEHLESNSMKIFGEEEGKFIIKEKEKTKFNNFGIIDINHPICLENLNKDNVHNDYHFFKPLDDLLIENEISLYIENIKLLLIKFINSKVYRESINQLFPTYYKILLSEKTLNDLMFYINNRIKFYPYQHLSNSGLTDKYSLYTYIPIIFPLDNFNDEVSSVFKVSSTFENSIHELNHANHGILYFKSNEKEMMETPEREGFRTGKEGGSNLEEILFDKKIVNFTLLEALYIINEKNFEQNLNDYKNNFLKMRNYLIPLGKKLEYLKIPKGGIFEELYDETEKTLKEEQFHQLHQLTYSMDNKSKNSILDYEYNIIRGKCCMGFP